MAQLKDTIVSGNLRVTDTTLTDTLRVTTIKAPTSSGGTAYGPGTNGQILKSNGTTTYWAADSNTDTKVTSTLLAQSTAAATYLPTFVSAAGNSGVNIMNSFSFRHTVGTTSAIGNSRIVLGNATASGAANNEEGQIVLYSSSTSYHTIKGSATASTVAHSLPTTGGTILNTGTTSFTRTLTSGTKIGSIKIDGTSQDIYAPTNTNTTYTLTQDSTDGHKITLTPSSGTAQTITIPDNDTTYSAGTGLSLSGTTFNHSNSVTAVTSAVFKKITYDAQGHITGTANVTASDLPSHTHGLLNSSFVKAASDTSDTGWSILGIDVSANGFILKSIRDNTTNTDWMSGDYGAGIVFGGSDTKGVISMKYNSPVITFAGGNHSSTATSPDWYIKITGTSGKTYNFDNYMGAVKIGSYYGMAWPDGTDKGNNSWIRTTRLGLIPYAANTDTTDGNVSALGTSTWTFAAGHIDNLYYKDLKTITVVAGSTADNAIDKMAGSYFFSGSGLFGGINDWVGIQAGYGSDKFQLVANGTAGVLYRHNDTGGTNTTSWTEIKNLMTPEAVFGQNGITVTKKTNTFGTGDTALTYDAGVNIGHSNSVTEVTNYNKPYVKYDAQGHITGSSYWTATAAGTGGESGWIKVATIVHTANYDNTPIMLLVSQRGNTVTYKLHIVWKNASNTDPNLDKFYLVSDESTSAEAYIIKTATSTWDLYIKKIDSYEAVAMHLYGGKYFDDHMRWTWTDVQTAASAITGGTEATKKVFYDSQLSQTANTVLAAPDGSNGTASFRKLVAADIPSLDYSKVSISRNLTSGTKVGTITIDGTATDLYCQTNTNTTYSAGDHLSLSSTTFSLASYCKSITDWNDATTNGWYMGSSVTNAPSTAWWFGRVVAHNNKYCMQEVWKFTASTDGHKVPHKMRMFVNSVWGDWVDITVGKQVPENALFTDANVTQTVTSSTYTDYHPLLIGNSSSATIGFTPSTNTGGAYASAEIYCQPSSGKVYASEFITNTYPSDSGSSLSQYGLYLKSYKKASLPAGGDYSYSRYAVRTYSGKSADNSGMILTMDSGGLTIVGGGESASALAALISDDQKDSNTSRTRLNVGGTLKTAFHGSSEQLILSSDNNMYFLTNCNTIANRKPVVLDTNSYFYPGTTKTGSIGTSSYMWNSVYAATVYENGKSLGSKYGLNNQIYGLNLTSDDATFNGAETLITSLPSSSGTSEPSYQRVTLKNFIKKVTGDIKEPVLYNNTTNPTQSATVTFDTNLGTPKYLKLFITVVSSSSYSAGGVTNVVDIDPLQYTNGCFVGHGSPGQYGVSTYLTYICILHSSPSTGQHTYNCIKSGSMSLSAGNDPSAITASVYITKVIAVY